MEYYYFSFSNSKLSLFVYSSEFGKLLLLVALVLKVCLLLIHTVISLHNITPLHPSKWQTFSHSYTYTMPFFQPQVGSGGLKKSRDGMVTGILIWHSKFFMHAKHLTFERRDTSADIVSSGLEIPGKHRDFLFIY